MIKPGLILACLGSFLVFSQLFGPFEIATFNFSLYSQIIGMFLLSTGLSLYLLGINMRQIFRHKKISRWQNHMIPSFSNAAGFLFISAVVGFLLITPMLNDFIGSGLSLADLSDHLRALALSGICIFAIGFNVFINSLIRSALTKAIGKRV
jgi:hypothetical protein